MAWIESHQEIARHPKTRRLARSLGVSVPTAIGHLHLLWWWALDYAEDGNLSGYSEDDLADAALWEGEPGEFVAALSSAGFLDADRCIHDWWEYAQRWIEKRRANAERMRAARAKPVPDTTAPRAAHVQRTSGARAGATGPNQTKPDLTGPETRDEARTAAAVAPPTRPKKPERNLGPLIDAFAAVGIQLARPKGGEAKAAADLLADWTPQQLVACWQDHASHQYGNDFSRRDLSFMYLSLRNRVGNWVAWREETAPPEPPPNGPAPVAQSSIDARSAVVRIPNAPGQYAHGVRCACSHVYSVMKTACPQCGRPKSELAQVSA